MALPPNYYDFVCKQRPFLVELVEQDVEDLLSLFDPPQVIHSVDDYNSRFHLYIERLNADLLGYGEDHPGITAEEMSPILSNIPQDVKVSLAALYNTIDDEYHSLVNFTLSGKKTFHFSENLSDHLANTEINVKSTFIQLPFPTCLFTFTSRSVIDAMHSIQGNTNFLDLDYSAPVTVFLTMHPMNKDLPGQKLLLHAWHAKMPNISYLTIKRELYLGENWTLEQSLRTDWKSLTPNEVGSGINLNSDENSISYLDDKIFYTDGLSFYRIILNALLYLSSNEAELCNEVSPYREIEARARTINSRPKRKKLLKTKGYYSNLDYQEVGASVGSIVIQKGEVTSDNINSSGEGKKIVRFMVRGHWRRQPYGSENQEHKLIWIRPYYKGTDLATTINKPYIVK